MGIGPTSVFENCSVCVRVSLSKSDALPTVSSELVIPEASAMLDCLAESMVVSRRNGGGKAGAEQLTAVEGKSHGGIL